MPATDLRCPHEACQAWQNWRYFVQEIGRLLQGWKGWVVTLIGAVVITFIATRLVFPLFSDGLEPEDIKVSECRSDSLRVQVFNTSQNDVIISDLKILRRNGQEAFEEFPSEFLDPDPRALFTGAGGTVTIKPPMAIDEGATQFTINPNTFAPIFKPSGALASGRFHTLEPQEPSEDCEYKAKVIVAKSGKEYTSQVPCKCVE